MTLCDVVRAIISNEKVSDRDIEATVMYLTRCDVMQDLHTLRRVFKALKADVKLEDAPVD